jgi:DNA topoisomerase-3
MIVVIAEKPSVGRDLARVLGATQRHEGYMEGNGYAVTWAFGHLVTLEEPEEYDPALKSWNLASLPFVPEQFKLKVSPDKGVKQQFAIIKKLLSSADSIICATDAGREGELIFRYIVKLCRCEKKPTQRLWISSMTDAAIKEGFRTLKPIEDFNALAAAASCRSQADWVVGLNATRAYTVLYSHGRGVLSVGRVQTPVLALIVNRDLEIKNFKPEDYWELWTTYRSVKFKHRQDRFKAKEEAQKLFEKVSGQTFTIVKIEEKTSSSPPPQLFDLTELQRTMNRLHSLTASQTLEIAQALYERKIITYPRTDSRYLSDDIYPQCASVLNQLSREFKDQVAPLDLQKLSKSKRFFDSGKVTDHHAIIPTGQQPAGLSPQESQVFRAIATRFISIFYPNCEKAHTTVHGEAAGEQFKAKGTQILKAGWFALYQSEKEEKKEDDEEQMLPIFVQGEQGEHQPEIKTCKTKPPPYYSEATLLTAMETAGKHVEDDALKEAMKERGLGTPATRAGIIETLLKREYIRKEKKQIHATDKGIELLRLLRTQPMLTSAEMTADWEFRLKQIEKGKMEAPAFMTNIREFITQIISSLKNPSAELENDLGSCPLCKAPVIKGREGFGCSAWKQGCQFRFHAHQFGTVLTPKDVQTLMYRGRLTYPRKLTDPNGQEIHGYITLDPETGRLGLLTREAKEAEGSLGACPLCKGAVVEKFKTYSCCDCDFLIWKTIAKRAVSKALVQVLLSKGKSQVLKGFRSKAGKIFSAALELKDGKVVFAFE